MLKHSSPQLMVLDLNMPELDGMAVLEQLKRCRMSAGLHIVLTAYGSISTAVKATRLGAADFLEKPLTPSVLRNTVRSVLNESEEDERPPSPQDADEYEVAIDKLRKSLRLSDAASAESLLVKVADRRTAVGGILQSSGGDL